MAKILREIERQIFAENLQLQIQKDVQSPFVGARDDADVYGASYVDDTFFHAINVSANVSLINIKRIAVIVIDTFAKHSLKINLLPGKTQFVLQFYGRDSSKLREEIFVDDNPSILVSTRFLGDVKILVGDTYPHMGSVFHVQPSNMPEIKKRTGSAVSALSDAKSILKNRNTSVKAKCTLVKSLSLSFSPKLQPSVHIHMACCLFKPV